VTALAIEVNDVGLVALAAGASRPLPVSPGVALFDGERVLLGTEAADQARLKPLGVQETYWDRLDTSPAGVPYPQEVRHADLAHAQLAALRAEAGRGITEVFLAVPGFYTTAALRLLLGVARAAGLPVMGLVDAAVAAASLGHPGEALVHLDLTRHRSVATAIAQGNGLARRGVLAEEGRGWNTFEEAWAGAVAAQFVRETRFDPRHAGPTEQALHDALPGWLDELCVRQAVPAVLRGGGREHTIELTRASLLDSAAGLYRALVGDVAALRRPDAPATVLLSHRASLPGLADRLREAPGVTVVELVSSAAVSGALQHKDSLRHAGDTLPFVTRLPPVRPALVAVEG
jgi:hypothetical protein